MQLSNDNEIIEDFDNIEQFASSQKCEVQLMFCKVKTPGRKKKTSIPVNIATVNADMLYSRLDYTTETH